MTTKREATFAAVLVMVMALAIILPPALGALGPFLIDDLGLRRSQIGFLAAAASLTGAVFAPWLGRVVDRWPGRGLLSALFGVIAAGLLSFAIAPNFRWLVAAALLVGVGMALGNPATNRLIAAHVSPGRRGVLVGLKQSGVQVGALIAGAVLPGLAAAIGWRGALGCLAACAAVAAATSWLAVPAPAQGTSDRPSPRSPDARSPGPDDRPTAAATTTSSARPSDHQPTDQPPNQVPNQVPNQTDRETRWLAVFSFVMATGTSALVTYLPLYAFDALGHDPVSAGAVGATLAFVAVGGRIGWARYADRTGDPWRVLVTLAGGAGAAQVLVLVAPAAPALLWLGAAILGATTGAWNAVVQLTIVRGGLRGTGRRTGIVHVAFSIGMAAGPALFGAALDRVGSYRPGWTTVLALDVVAAGMAWSWWQHNAPAAAID